jgi:formimidoylglutamase
MTSALMTFAKLTTRGNWPECAPTRFAASIERGDPRGCSVALLGLPDDLGVRLNGGRSGANAGPDALRDAMARYGGQFDGLRGRALDVRVFDAGDVVPAVGDDAATLHETHARVRRVVGELHAMGLVPLCIGGGHDLSFPAIAALADGVGPLGGVNLDAHLDVRQRVGSGMPFRRLIEERCLDATRFVELGLGRFVNDQADVQWLAEQGARLVWIDEVLQHGARIDDHFALAFTEGQPGFVSIDLDGLDQSVVSGVSATNPLGASVWHATTLAEAAGRSSAIRHFDVMELSPVHDPAAKSARVAALIVLSFLAGFSQRPLGAR